MLPAIPLPEKASDRGPGSGQAGRQISGNGIEQRLRRFLMQPRVLEN